MSSNTNRTRGRAWAWAPLQIAALLVLLCLAPALSAQQLVGNVFGYVTDEQGGRLPGVTVTLTGVGAPKTQTTDSRGEYRFLNLDPGTYTLAYELQGFTKVTKPDVQVSVGQNTNTSAALKISSVEATVTVKGEPSLLDTRKVENGAVVDQEQLKSIPTARDPWVILQTVPGVQMDRVNIGGNESGQQSNYSARGSQADQNAWNIDGVTITDMSALGGSPMYYDFDSFEEMHASTGGSDVTAAAPGVQLNLVTKRGTNDIHGSARIFLAEGDWQWDNLPAEAEAQGVRGGNRVDEVQDYGVEVGGPLIKDRLWLWGAYGRNQVNLLNVNGNPDNTTLKDTNGKLNAQLFDSTALAGTFTDGNKIKAGRGVSPLRPPPASWNQDGPSRVWKGELSQVFSSSLFMTASYSHVDNQFSLLPQGGTDYNQLFIDPNGVFTGSYLAYTTVRPQEQVNANGSFFFSTGQMGHELKYGFTYRSTGVDSTSAWPGAGNYGDLADFNVPAAALTRQAVTSVGLKYYSGYFSDTLTLGNMTINAGVRYDNQSGKLDAVTIPGNPVFGDLLPTINFNGSQKPFTWDDVVPRIGLTYALGEDKKTLLRASYSQYADQLGSGTISFANAGALSAEFFPWNDANGDHVVDRGEVDLSQLLYFYGLDPAHPANTVSPNVIDPNLKAGRTHEATAGIEREVLPEFVVGVAYTWRRYSGAIYPHRTGLTAGDYEVAGFLDGTLADGSTFHQPYYSLKPGVDIPAGVTLSNRPDWHTLYNGVDLNFQKRLTNKWMVRGAVTWQDWKQKGGLNSCYDPTSNRGGNALVWPGTAIPVATGTTCALDDIAAAPAGAYGSKTEVFLNSRWQFNVGGLYQLPWDFAIAANVYGREGYPYLQYVRFDPGDGLGTRDNIIGALGDHRYKDVFDADLRLEKVIQVRPLQITLSADIFNLLNSGTVLQRNARTPGTATANDGTVTAVDSATYNNIFELQSPRLVRFGARISF